LSNGDASRNGVDRVDDPSPIARAFSQISRVFPPAALFDGDAAPTDRPVVRRFR
jgi:hypothetical protein